MQRHSRLAAVGERLRIVCLCRRHSVVGIIVVSASSLRISADGKLEAYPIAAATFSGAEGRYARISRTTWP